MRASPGPPSFDNRATYRRALHNVGSHGPVLLVPDTVFLADLAHASAKRWRRSSSETHSETIFCLIVAASRGAVHAMCRSRALAHSGLRSRPNPSTSLAAANEVGMPSERHLLSRRQSLGECEFARSSSPARSWHRQI